MNLEINKTTIPILNILKILIIVLGIVGFMVCIYQIGKFHGMIQTINIATGHKPMCDIVGGEYNNNTKSCYYRCDDESKYITKYLNTNICITEKPSFGDKLEILLLSGIYIKEKDIMPYIKTIGLVT